MQIKLRLITRNVTFVWSDLSFSPLLDECVFWETKLHPKFCPSFSEWQQSGHLHNPVWKYFNKNWSCEEEQLQEQNGPMCQKAQKGADTRKVLIFFHYHCRLKAFVSLFFSTQGFFFFLTTWCRYNLKLSKYTVSVFDEHHLLWKNCSESDKCWKNDTI